jgi:hypothetical protein
MVAVLIIQEGLKFLTISDKVVVSDAGITREQEENQHRCSGNPNHSVDEFRSIVACCSRLRRIYQ